MDELVEERLRCRGCGAGLKYSGGSLALECEYCDTVTEIERPQDRPEGVPELVVPLAVDENALRTAVYTAMTKGDYTPDDLLEQAVFARLERFYVPVYLFKGNYEAAWTASFGFERTEQYTTYETRHSNGESRQVPVTHTRTVVDWTPVSGMDVGSFAVLGYAGTRLPDRAIALVESCTALDRATPYAPAFSSGVEMEAVAASGKDAYDRRGLPQVTAIIDRSVKAHAQGNQQRDWHFKATTERAAPVPMAIPVCHAVFQYRGQSYHVWTDGINPGRQVADPLPQDKARRARVAWGYATPVLTAAALAWAGFRHDPPGPLEAVSVSTLGALAAAACFTVWRRHVILSHSRRTRQALLAARTAAFGHAAAAPIGTPRKPWALDPSWDIPALVVGTAIGCAWALGLPASWYPAAPPAPASRPAPVTTAAGPAPAAPVAAASSALVHDLAPLAPLMTEVQNGDWNAIDGALARIGQDAGAARGNRKAARAANAQGLKALRRKDPAAAIAAFKRAVKADPSDPEAQHNLGIAQLQADAPEAAAQACAAALARAPRRSAAWLTLGDALARAGQGDDARASLLLAVAFSADRRPVLAVLERMAQSHQFPAVRDAAAQALQKAPTIPQEH